MANENPISLPDQERLKELARRANAGDTGALGDLRKYLDKYPEIWQKIGDIAAHVRESHIARIAQGDHLAAETMRRNVEFLRKDLAGPRLSSVERIAIDGVISSWLDVQAMHIKFAPDAGGNLATAKYIIQLRNAAHRRYDAAMKTLVLIQEKMPAIDRANRRYLRKKGKLVSYPQAAVS